MRVSRIQFDDSEPTDSIARRIACAFDPGNVLKIRDSFFKMSSLRVMNQTSGNNVVGDNYTLILNPGEPIPEELLKPPPPPVVVPEPEPEEADWEEADDPVEAVVKSETVAEPIIPEPPKVLVEQVPDPVPEPEVQEELKPAILEEVELVVAPAPPDSVPPPPNSEVFMSKPVPSIDGKPLDGPVSNESPTSESGEFRINLPKASAAQTKIEIGQVWQSKDTRRHSAPFVVVNVDSEFVYQDNGRKISLDRMFRYKRVS